MSHVNLHGGPVTAATLLGAKAANLPGISGPKPSHSVQAASGWQTAGHSEVGHRYPRHLRRSAMTSSRTKYDSDYLLRLRSELHEAPVETVALQALTIAGSPRSTIENPDHIRALAELDGPLPPILVHRESMTIIDGIHRLRAAQLQGRTHIDVRYFEGSAADGQLLAVALNVAHGLPLSFDERAAAARRILTKHPEWSDRAVASIAGLSPKKTADIRCDLFGDTVADDRRVGRDGRARPLDPSQGRMLAAVLLRQNPNASLRQIAKKASISPTTVADVRKCMARGESPTRPEARPPQGTSGQGTSGQSTSERRRPPRRTPAASSPPSDVVPATELAEILELLRRDPSLRFNDVGRSILRLLDANAAFARNKEDIAASLPPHCMRPMAKLSQAYARSWQLFTEQLRDLSDGREGESSFEARSAASEIDLSNHPGAAGCDSAASNVDGFENTLLVAR